MISAEAAERLLGEQAARQLVPWRALRLICTAQFDWITAARKEFFSGKHPRSVEGWIDCCLPLLIAQLIARHVIENAIDNTLLRRMMRKTRKAVTNMAKPLAKIKGGAKPNVRRSNKKAGPGQKGVGKPGTKLPGR
jgi:hypothetical protein